MLKRTSILLAAALCGASTVPTTPLHAQATVASSAPPVRIAEPGPALRDAFERADRNALDDATRARFDGQPLAGWLDYANLRGQLDTLPLARGNGFLAAHRGEPVADAFRPAWLAALAKRNAWSDFLANWDAGIDDAQLRCQRLQALMATNRVDAEWTREAQSLWRSSGKSLPEQCDAPFARLEARGDLDDTLRWERFDLATAAAQTGLMRFIAKGLTGAGDAAQANAYAAYVEAPDAAVGHWPKTARSRLVASTALARLAKSSPDRAEALLPQVATALAFTEADSGRVLAQIALWTAASYLPESARRLAAVPAASFDESLHEWQVREALARSDWAAALAAIRGMPDDQRNRSRWLYFAARTSALTGDRAGAAALYAQAARSADYYGFLSSDRLGQPYALCPLQLDLSTASKRPLAADPGIVRALQLYALGRKGWALREWNAALARFDDRQRRLAVAVAEDNGWFDRGVFGLVKVAGRRYPDEKRLYQLRFPLHHADTIRREARRNALDPAWVAAEIRAESIFDPRARSPADARGLMQVLPSTGATVARRIGLPFAGAEALYDADTNITLGTAYLRQLLDRFDGKPYLVIAGYNAGPGAANRWLTQRPSLDADFWIETISYRETREYVARVLGFSVIYDWRLDGNALRLSDRMLGNTNGPRKGFVCPPATPPTATPTTTGRLRQRR